MACKNVSHVHRCIDGERKGGRFLLPSPLQTRCEVVLSPDGQGQVSHTKFSYSSKKLCDSARHVLWGRRLRISSYTELLLWEVVYGNVRPELWSEL